MHVIDVILNIIPWNMFPGDWAMHLFMRRALLAIILITPIFGLLGSMVVNNRMAFFSDTLGHSALTGIAIGVLCGFDNPTWSMVILAILIAVGVTAVKRMTGFAPDTVIGIFSATTVALGIFILSRGGGFNKYSNYLIGDILSIGNKEIIGLILVIIFVTIFWAIFFNKLLLVSINSVLARSRGINVFMVEVVFAVVVAVIVAISIQWVGLLIINSLLILPASASRNITANVKTYHLLTVLISLFSGLAGLIFSYYLGTATGATIVLISAAMFLITFTIRQVKE